MKAVNVNKESRLKDVAGKILAQGFDANAKPERFSSGVVHGIGFIGLPDNVIVECLLLSANNGSLDLGLSLPDVARVISSNSELNMVFFPALSANLSEYLLTEKFAIASFPHNDSIADKSEELLAIYCKLSSIDYNKGNKSISAMPTLFSDEHFELLKYLITQNDKWSAVING